jgi:hypothetical protein
MLEDHKYSASACIDRLLRAKKGKLVQLILVLFTWSIKLPLSTVVGSLHRV